MLSGFLPNAAIMIALACLSTVLCTFSLRYDGASVRLLSAASTLRLQGWKSSSAVPLSPDNFALYLWSSFILNSCSNLAVLFFNGCDEYKISNTTSQHTLLSTMSFLLLRVSFFLLQFIVNFRSFSSF